MSITFTAPRENGHPVAGPNYSNGNTAAILSALQLVPPNGDIWDCAPVDIYEFTRRCIKAINTKALIAANTRPGEVRERFVEAALKEEDLRDRCWILLEWAQKAVLEGATEVSWD